MPRISYAHAVIIVPHAFSCGVLTRLFGLYIVSAAASASALLRSGEEGRGKLAAPSAQFDLGCLAS